MGGRAWRRRGRAARSDAAGDHRHARLSRTPPTVGRVRHARALPRRAPDAAAPGVDRRPASWCGSPAATARGARRPTTRPRSPRSTRSTPASPRARCRRRCARGGSASRAVWSRMNDDAGGRLGRALLGRVAIPGGVAMLNRLGLGPFRPEISAAQELRRAGLVAMGRVADALAPDGAEHVVFGHTHRAGPLPGDDRGEWTQPGAAAGSGTPATGTASPPSAAPAGSRNPYAAGHLVRLGDEGEPALENAAGLSAAGRDQRLLARRAERVGGLVELAQALAEGPGEGRPERRVAAVAVDVPALAAAATPRRSPGSARRSRRCRRPGPRGRTSSVRAPRRRSARSASTT